MKGPGDFVSVADQRTESILIGELQKARSGYPILSEEVGWSTGRDKSHRFIIDPIDGTTNFLHGIPHFAIAIAMERDGLLQSSVVYNPITDEMFTAERAHGAYLNDKRLRVAGRKSLAESVVATGTPNLGHAEEHHTQFHNELNAVMATTTAVRRFGAATLDLAYVAAGRFDVFWERGLAAWDMAAGGASGARGGRRGHRPLGRRPDAQIRAYPGRQRGAAPPIPETP